MPVLPQAAGCATDDPSDEHRARHNLAHAHCVAGKAPDAKTRMKISKSLFSKFNFNRDGQLVEEGK